MEKITVAVADDDAEFRMKIRALISAQADMKFVGDSSSALGAVNLVISESPKVLLMSTDMCSSVISSFDAAKYIKTRHPATMVVFLAEGEHKLIDRGISKQSPAEEMLEVIRQACRVQLLLPAGRAAVKRLSQD